METLSCRLLPWSCADGPTNMAADEVLVCTAAESGLATLRFYGWSPPTLSLGYFQPASVRLAEPRLAALPFVRRPSGGATLVHHHEFTYALALPPGSPWQDGNAWMPRLHRIIAAALIRLGVPRPVEPAAPTDTARHGDVLCFQQFTPGDLLCAGMKVVGSAQRKVRRALLQHGSILLATSPHTPALPGLAELTGYAVVPDELIASIQAQLEMATGWRLSPGEWTDAERQGIAKLVAEKYATTAWNERR